MSGPRTPRKRSFKEGETNHSPMLPGIIWGQKRMPVSGVEQRSLLFQARGVVIRWARAAGDEQERGAWGEGRPSSLGCGAGGSRAAGEPGDAVSRDTRWGPGPRRSSWTRDCGRSSPGACAATALCEPEGPQMAASLNLLPVTMGRSSAPPAP